MSGLRLLQAFMLLCLATAFWLWPWRAYRRQQATPLLPHIRRLYRVRLIGLALAIGGVPFLGSDAAPLGVGIWPLSIGGCLALVASMGLAAHRRYERGRPAA